MKRFLRFSYQTYYPGGGALDFDKDFDTVEEAQKHRLDDDGHFIDDADDNEQASILDTETGDVYELVAGFDQVKKQWRGVWEHRPAPLKEGEVEIE